MARVKKIAVDAKKKLATILKRKGVATMDELGAALGTHVRMTIYRLLKDLSYRTSYSHGGRYYALKETIQFDEMELWTYHSVWFSKHGTLMATLEKLVSDSESGYFAHELGTLLHVSVAETLLRLVQKGRIFRERVSNAYLYCSTNSAIHKRQFVTRAAELGVAVRPLVAKEEIPDEVKAAIVLFATLLDERQLRLFAGVEALQCGHGAERWIADLLDIHRQTVAKGRQQLLDGDVLFERVRRKGAGRPKVEKKPRKSSSKSNS